MEDALFNDEPYAVEGEVVDVYSPTPEEQEAFVQDVLGTNNPDYMPKNAPKERDLTPREAQLPKWTTEGGKEIRLRQMDTGKYEIIFYPGGELPSELKGTFTDERTATIAVNKYLAK